MRILLDESLPRPLGSLLTGHEVSTVRDESWTSLTNGELLRRAAERFDVVITADQNLQFQQNLQTLPIAVVVLVADSNRLESLEPLVPDVRRCRQQIEIPRIVVQPAALGRRRSIAVSSTSSGRDDLLRMVAAAPVNIDQRQRLVVQID